MSHIMSPIPLISVVIPTKDRPADLAQALNSIGEQSYTNIEAVVIDDGSAIEQSDIIDAFRCKYSNIPLILHKNPSPKGGGYCRKLGTDVSNGEFVCFLDDDDIYLPNKLEVLAGYLLQNADVEAVFGRVIIRKENHSDELINYSQYEERLESIRDITRLQTNGSLIRKSALLKANFSPSLKKFQDTQFHIELCRKVNCHLLDEPVAVWHKSYSAAQVSHVGKNNAVSVIERFDDLFSYLQSSGVLTPEDNSFLLNQRLKYTAKLSSFKAGLIFSLEKSPVVLLKFLIYRTYYALKSALPGNK